jgi:phage shock protein C
MSDNNHYMKQLYRSRTNKIFAGILGGIGDLANIDPTILRLIYLMITVFTGFVPGLLVYIVAIFIVPKQPTHRVHGE